MNLKSFFAATLAAGIVANAIDTFVQGGWFNSNYYSKAPLLFRQDGEMWMFILGDFVSVAVFTWFYQVVRNSFGVGLMNGLRFGVYAGILISFPMYLFLHLMLLQWSYSLSWALTIYTILWCAIVGAIAGVIHEKVQ
jgi:hypothetical protein